MEGEAMARDIHGTDSLVGFLRELELISNRYGIFIEVAGSGTSAHPIEGIEICRVPDSKRIRYGTTRTRVGGLPATCLETYVDDYSNPIAARAKVRVGDRAFVPDQNQEGLITGYLGGMSEVWINLPEGGSARRIRRKIEEIRILPREDKPRPALDRDENGDLILFGPVPNQEIPRRSALQEHVCGGDPDCRECR